MTAVVMMEIAGRKEDGYLRPEDFRKFPRLDLLTIDRLWVHFSKGRFGFSIQKSIWEELGGRPNANPEIYQEFSERLGWLEVHKDQDNDNSSTISRRWNVEVQPSYSARVSLY